MDEERLEENALAAESLDYVEAVLLRGRRLRSRAREAPDLSALVCYLSGTLSADRATELEEALLQEPTARNLLRQVHRELQSLQRFTWSEVAERAGREEEPIAAGVAQAWMDLLTEVVPIAPASPGRWLAEGWARIRAEVSDGIVEAQAAWTAFLSFGAQWAASLRLQGLTPATQRGFQEAKIAQIEGAKAGIAIINVECDIRNDGSLQVVARIAPMPAASPAQTQATLLLSLRRDDDIWPLATGQRFDGRIEWSLPGFGTALELPTGPLPPQFFSFDVTEAAYRPREGVRPLRSEVFDATGQPDSRALAYIELVTVPRLENREFHVDVVIPAFIRMAYPAHRLELALSIAEQWRQPLGRWAVCEWEDGPRPLSAPCPGIPEATFSVASILQARLRSS